MSETRVISDSSLRFLASFGENLTIHNNLRTISLSTITSVESDDTVEVPDTLNSVESLEFCGLNNNVAVVVYDRWRRDHESVLKPEQLGYGYPIISFAKDYVRDMASTRNAMQEGDDWDAALKHQGLKDATRRRIMDTRFEHLRKSQSAAFWALDTLDLSWEFLDGLDRRLQKSKDASELRSISPDASAKPSRAVKPGSSSLNTGLHSGSSSLKTAVEEETPKQVEGRTLVYKGGAYTRLISIFNADGSLNLTKIVSTPPCDFHPIRLDLYFTKQWDVAVEYAGFAHTRVPSQEPTVLTAAIPSEYTSSSVEVFGHDWRKLVWLSRNRSAFLQNGGALPGELSAYTEADVLIGLTCRTGGEQIERMTSAEELTVLKTQKGDKVTQVALNGARMIPRFLEECRGYVWVASMRAPKRAKHFRP
ncbi:hypothetical protein PMIN06_004548 [Paraphaeosphaeria minitans]